VSEEYIEWSALEVDDLTRLIGSTLADERAKFLSDSEDLHDTDERFATRAYLSSLKSQVQEWCEHFDLPFDAVRDYDQRCYPGAPAGPMSWHINYIDYSALAAAIASGFGAFPSGQLYRPKVFETATVEVMKWLRTRPQLVDRVDPRSFEVIVAEVLKDRGWQVELTKQTRDGGYDILAVRADPARLTIRLMVECKLYDLIRPVGLAMVDRLMGVVSREYADRGLLVTNSRFSSVAWQRWESRVGRDLALVDREELFEWLRTFRGGD
jgi:Restriction endonuclease